jgi:hypothetical protein
MSIDDLLLDRVKRGMLRPLLPLAPGMIVRRTLLLSERLWCFLHLDSHDAEMEKRIGELLADLERFVTDASLHHKYLFLLYPEIDCVWEIKSSGYCPSIRVLGLFPTRDVFVATTIALREDLGGWQSREWKAVKRAARSAWNGLCGPYEPIRTSNVSNVVTGAIHGKYYKG